MVKIADEPSPAAAAARERIARSTRYRQMERRGLEPHQIARREG